MTSTHRCAPQTWFATFTTSRLALLQAFTANNLQTSFGNLTQWHQNRLQSWIITFLSHFHRCRKGRYGTMSIPPYHGLIVYSHQMEMKSITCWCHCFWFRSHGEQHMSCVIDRVCSVNMIHSADERLCRFDCLLCEVTNTQVLQQVMMLFEDLPWWSLHVICKIGNGVTAS